jgi:small-conductance mechanosensitive channel
VAVASPRQHPIRLVVRDDLERNRLTVFFRLLLAIPHLIWLVLWGIAAFVVSFVNWLAVVIQGSVPSVLHDFVAGYLRYATQVSGYLFLAASPYPSFRGRPGYPIDLEIDPPARQSRWAGFFRLVLAIPALILAAMLGGGLSFGSPSGSWGAAGGDRASTTWSAFSSTGVAAAAAFLAWFAILARGRAPRGLRDLIAYALGYAAQAGGYLFLLTGRYPNSNPEQAGAYAELPPHPVQMVVTDDLGRPRLTVAFRLLLAIPHIFWLLIWAFAVFFAAIIAWFAALITGRVPSALHRFMAAFVRYSTHVIAYVYVIGRRFPGFTGRSGSYGIDVEIAPPERQSRWKTLFRLFLVIPAAILNSALGGVALVAGVLGWWFSLVAGRMPEGLRNLGAACLRYSAQTSAYVLLLTDRYPYSAPVLEGRRALDTGPPAPMPLPASQQTAWEPL